MTHNFLAQGQANECSITPFLNEAEQITEATNNKTKYRLHNVVPQQILQIGTTSMFISKNNVKMFKWNHEKQANTFTTTFFFFTKTLTVFDVQFR